ncbi:MAG TPA: phage tail assembly protein [Lysobacter sp.]
MSKTEKPTPETAVDPNVVTLEEPIQRGDQKITTVTVRKPAAGELRGVSLAELLQLDVASLITVLPRITSPILTQADVAKLEPADLLQLGGKVAGFLLTKAAKESASLDA